MAVADLLGVARRRVARAVREGVADPRRATREEADREAAVLADRPRRRAAQAMLRRAVPLAGDRPDYARAAAIARGYADVTVPCLIDWGEQDDTLPVATGYKLASEIPGARLRVVTAAKHCLPVERPRACATLVRDFIRGPGELTGPAQKIARLDPVPGPPFLAAAPSPLPRPNCEVAAAPAAATPAAVPARSPVWRAWISLLLSPGRSRLLPPRVAVGVPPLMFFVDLAPAED